MTKGIPIMLCIVGALVISGCVSETGEIIEKDGQIGDEKQNLISASVTKQESVTCEHAGLIIQGMSYQEGSLLMMIANTGKKDLTIRAKIKYLTGNYDNHYSIAKIGADTVSNEIEITGVNENIDTVFIISEECPMVQDFLTRQYVMGLEDDFCDGCIEERVMRIIDGDTLVAGSTTIRLALADTPERGENGFSEATDFTESVCPIGSVAHIDIDDGQDTDRYGRTVAVVYCGGYNLNEQLLEYGYAVIDRRFCDESEFGDENWAIDYGCGSYVQELCYDGIDNDGNGFVDCIDWSCACSPSCKEDCYDGIDNDGDGYIDFDDWYCDWHCG